MNDFDLICVVGPTASGKSELAVKLAKKFNGEIISADSRQIYRGLNIGSGKVEGKWKKEVFIYNDVPHYLIDEANPKTQYSVAKFQREADKKIKEILKRGKLPIICGGTGHWIDAAVNGQVIPEVKPQPELRKVLSMLNMEELFNKLKKLDPSRAKNIDRHNPRRLIRALEIVMTTGKPVPSMEEKAKYKTLWLGLNPDKETLNLKIQKRLTQRIKQGLIKEVSDLHKAGLSWKKLEDFGLEYKFCTQLLQNKITQPEMEELLLTAIRQYAKRQMTWWKRNSEIHWSTKPQELLTLAKNSLK